MSNPICAACGTWYPEAPASPAACPICEDDRQYVPRGGQQWLTSSELARTYANRLEDDDGVPGIGMVPAFAINQRCCLVETASGTVLWETTSLVTDQAVQAILARGPVKAIAISHPHFYAAMVRWAEALDCPIMLPAADRAWVQCPSSRIRFWEGDRCELAPGLTLIRCGGHFAGSSVLHWQDQCCPEGALFAGDTVQVALDRKRVSAMHSYPNAIPLGPEQISAIASAIVGLRFDRLYGYTWGRNVIANGDRIVAESLAAYLKAIAPG
ncbi:MAG: MBL fold metallo-hydrolase [Proteobacteria bacterium]|nr:MBL fold metallo-hydrolase [Pseudomonadota bacterium]